MKKVYKINSAAEMKKFGQTLAGSICEDRKKSAVGAYVVALEGELGTGKTQFAKGLARGLGIKRSINSPTFVICKSYGIPSSPKKICPDFTNFFHIDCYRLESSDQARLIGIDKIIGDPQNIVAIEWPRAVKNLMPQKKVCLKFEMTAKNQRLVRVADRDKKLFLSWRGTIG